MPHKLLLADDSVTIQRVIELTFADEDVQVLAVGDGKQAIARVLSDRPDIVLADVGMPERDGYEVAAFIKGNPELAHIPVLLLTGAFEPIDEARAQAVGCDGVLVKPFEPQMVINRVKDLLAGRRPQGLWSASPAAQIPLRQPSPAVVPGGDFDLRGAVPQPPPAAQGGALEDYFDRLDAAFASLDSGVAPAAAPAPVEAPPARTMDAAAPPHPSAPPHPPVPQGFSPVDDLAGWDPELTGDPARPAPIDTRPADIEPPRAIAPPPAYVPPASPVPGPPYAMSPAPAAAPLPSLAEAFATLLSAERGQPVAPSQVRPGMLSDEVIDDIVRRVTERMNDRAVRDTVVDVAERLVREEIARIKGR